ncbi:hypothetical protein B0H16DRAFT_1309419, partial [Mycena metata]
WVFAPGVTLRAEDSIFHVTKSILAARSTVFESMFHFPQPASGGDEIMDGSPIVRLDDSAVDVEAFLRAIFDSNYFMPPPAAIDFHAVLGILRLSHKYDIGYLHKRAILHLETVFPLDLANYHADVPNTLGYVNGDISPEFKAIPILQAVDASWLLPYAFYSVGTYSPDHFFRAGAAWTNMPDAVKTTCLRLGAHHWCGIIRANRWFDEVSTCPSSVLCSTTKLAFLRSE